MTRTALNAYGKDGDGSFECTGFSVLDGTIRDFKCYRYYKKNSHADSISINGIYGLETDVYEGMAEVLSLIGALKACENIRLFDLSLSKVNQNDGRGKLRAVFSAGNNAAAAVDKFIGSYVEFFGKDDIIRQLSDITAMVSAGENQVLSQFGIEAAINENKKTVCVTGAKLYFNIGKNLEGIDSLNGFTRQKACIKNLLDIYYSPFMLGYNISENSAETKLYFLDAYIKALFNKIKNKTDTISSVLLREMTALERIGVSQDIIDLTALDKIDKMGLYLKGIAISTKNWNNGNAKNSGKGYFFPKI